MTVGSLGALGAYFHMETEGQGYHSGRSIIEVGVHIIRHLDMNCFISQKKWVGNIVYKKSCPASSSMLSCRTTIFGGENNKFLSLDTGCFIKKKSTLIFHRLLEMLTLTLTPNPPLHTPSFSSGSQAKARNLKVDQWSLYRPTGKATWEGPYSLFR